MDGFIILHGNANGLEQEHQSGAGIVNYGALHLLQCRIEQCSSTDLGSLVLNSGSSAVLILQDVTSGGMDPSNIWNVDGAEMTLLGVIQME